MSVPGATIRATQAGYRAHKQSDTDVLAEEIGYRGSTAAGITYGMLDYWARTGLVEPSVRATHGPGSQRLYSFRDILAKGREAAAGHGDLAAADQGGGKAPA